MKKTPSKYARSLPLARPGVACLRDRGLIIDETICASAGARRWPSRLNGTVLVGSKGERRELKRGDRVFSSAQSASTSIPSDETVESIVAAHGSTILATARRFSQNAADAEDAYQRAFERLLTKAPSVPSNKLLPWLITVVRNEALMIIRSRKHASNGVDEDFLLGVADESPSPEECVVDRETITVGHAALRKLHPDQLRCLLLRADGFDYASIEAATGFSFAKVNRCLSDGRSALREGFSKVASGAECRRLENALSLFADGMLDAPRRAEVQRHLGECMYCRATLRDFRSAPASVAALMPLAVGAAGLIHTSRSMGSGMFRQAVDGLQSLSSLLQQRVSEFVAPHVGADVALAKKIVMISAVSVSVVAGGVTAERAVEQPDPPAVFQPTGATGAAPQAVDQATSGTGGVDSSGRARDAATASARPRDARASDLIGDHAVVNSTADGGQQPDSPGDSANGPEPYVAPLPQNAGSDHSSGQSTDLAP